MPSRPPSPVESVLAVDAGQSGTRFRLIRGDRREEWDAAPVRADSDIAAQLADLIPRSLAERGATAAVLAVGSTGVAPDDARARDLLTAARASGVHRVALAHDSISAYLAAVGLEPGAVVAAGTGVVTLGVGPAGVVRVDGWGHLLGDAGSGYWLGRRGIDLALRSFDGRGPSTVLLDAARSAFGDAAGIPAVLQESPHRVSTIAAFARTVLDAAEAGDAVARAIVEQGADELASAAAAALARSGWTQGDDAPTSWAGSLLTHAHAYREAFGRALARPWPGARLTSPAGGSLDGVALLATLPPGHALAASVAFAASTPREQPS